MPFAISTSGLERTHGLRSMRCFDFSGGLDLTTSPLTLAHRREKNKWLLKATNIIFAEDGSLKRRPGFTLVSSDANLTGANGRVLGGTQFRLSSGTVHDVVATKAGKIFKLDASGVATQIKTGLTATTLYSFAVYNDVLYIANGVDAPQQWDGTTFAAMAGSPPATTRLLVTHANRMFATATAAPSRLYYSALNNPQNWTAANDAGNIDINPNDNSVIGPMVSGIQELVVLKGNRPYRLQGIGPVTGYSIVDNLIPVGGSIGAQAMLGATFALNDTWYASQLGFHRLKATNLYGDLQESFISEPVKGFFRADVYLGSLHGGLHPWNFRTISAEGAAQVLYSQFFGGIFISGSYFDAAGVGFSGSSSNTELLFYDLSAKAWARWTVAEGGTLGPGGVSAMWTGDRRDGVFSPSELFLALSISSGSYIVRAGYTVRETDQDGSGGTDAVAMEIEHIIHLGQTSSVRYIVLHFDKYTNGSMTLTLTGDFLTTFTATLDLDNTSSTRTEVRVDVGSMTCEYLQVSLSSENSKLYKFYGYEVFYRPRRALARGD